MTFLQRARLMFLIFLNGYVSLSLELVVLRYLGFYVGSSAVVTSIIMGVFLGFMSLGYWLGNGRFVRNGQIPRVVGASFLIISALILVAASFPLISEYFVWLYRAGITSRVAQTFVFSGVLLSVGPFLFGFNTTLLSRMMDGGDKNHTGQVMAMDTIGSVLGSMMTTLVLMPLIGVNNTVIVICAAGLMGAVLIWRRWYVWMAGLLLIAMCILVNSNYYQRTRYGIIVNNANSTIQVETEPYGDGQVLYMNNLPMSVFYKNTRTSAQYVDYVNQRFIYTMPHDVPRKILVLGAGGFTVGLDDDFNDYTYVDIEHTLKDVAENLFLGEKLGPNKKFVVQDASQYLKNTEQLWDVIMLDVYSNSYQVPEALITAEFMMRIRQRVAPNGIVIMNIIASPMFDDDWSRVFDNTFHAVFTSNTARDVIGDFNPWEHTRDEPSNIIYIWYNRENNGRIYTVNNSSVLYDIY